MTHGLALNIAVQGYAGSLEFSINACGHIVLKLKARAAALSRSLHEINEILPE